MHYKNGRAAKVGDLVVGKQWDGTPIAGIVCKTTSGADSCNIEVVPINTTKGTFTASDFMLADEALTATKHVYESEPQ